MKFPPLESDVLLLTHAELWRDRDQTNPCHVDKGLNKINVLAYLTLKLIEDTPESGGLKVLLTGEGTRYEDIFNEIKRQAKFEVPADDEEVVPDVILGGDALLGGPSSRRSKRNRVYSVGGNNFKRINCRLIGDYISKPQGWATIKLISSLCKGIKVLCAGRQCMKILGLGKDFAMAGAFELDWRTQQCQCRIKDAEIVL